LDVLVLGPSGGDRSELNDLLIQNQTHAVRHDVSHLLLCTLHDGELSSNGQDTNHLLVIGARAHKITDQQIRISQMRLSPFL
jgi:hypothetical protein